MGSRNDDQKTVSGISQSPIDIQTSAVIEDIVAPIYINYPADDIGEVLSNTGHDWKVQCNGRKTEFYGGPLNNKYKLEQFHCHWGPGAGIGSEHTINGKSYSGELHFVHWNADKYDSFESASKQKDGLAVLAVFLDIGPVNSELLKITALLPRCKNAGDQIILTDLVGINLEKFLPTERNYWTYLGSLTTPPFYETVTWIIFEEPISISEQQLNVFRSLKVDHSSDHVAKDGMKSKSDSNPVNGSRINGTMNNGIKNDDLLNNDHLRSKREISANHIDNHLNDSKHIIQNYRATQALNNRVIRKYCHNSSNIIEK